MSKSLKQAIFAFICLLIFVTTLASDQIAALFASSYQLFIPSWLSQPVIPQALLDKQATGITTLYWIYLVLAIGLGYMGYSIYCLETKKHKIYPHMVKFSAIYILPILGIEYATSQHSFDLYTTIVTSSKMNMFQWQQSTGHNMFTMDLISMALFAISIHLFSTGRHPRRIMTMYFAVLPITTTIMFIFAKLPPALLTMWALYCCGAVYVLLNHFNVQFSHTSSATGLPMILGAVAVLWVLSVSDGYKLNVTADFQVPAHAQIIRINGDSVTAKTSLRGLDGQTKHITIMTNRDFFYQETPVTINGTINPDLIQFEQLDPLAGRYAGVLLLIFPLCLSGLIRRLNAN